MRSLHVAAMPFPSHQGTQAAVRAMVDVLAGIGRDTHLLTYAHGAFPIDPAFVLHRVPDFPRVRSLRSGPSIGKVALDVAMVRALRRLHGELAPDVVVAHHVEAATAALAARVRPLVFVAHTALGPELPTYAPPPLAEPLARVGDAADRALVTRAGASCAVSPMLRDRLIQTSGAGVTYVPVPWPVPAERTADERARGRRRHRLTDRDEVILYAGNLDRYQGWEDVLDAFASLASSRPDARLLVATESDPTPLHDRALAAGIGHRVRIARLDGEEARRELHAAADVAAVPRRAMGGVSIKLLDALARGVPTVTTARAAAGLDLRGSAVVVADDDPDAIATGVRIALSAPDAAGRLGTLARAYVATDHAPARFAGALDEAIDRARDAGLRAPSPSA